LPSAPQAQLENNYNKQTVTINLDAEKLLWDNIIQYGFTGDGGEVFRDQDGKVRKYADQGDWGFWPIPVN